MLKQLYALLCITLISVLMSVSAHAVNWVKYRETNRLQAYIDTDSIGIESGFVFATGKVDLATNHIKKNGKVIKSIKGWYGINCQQRLRSTLALSYLDEKNEEIGSSDNSLSQKASLQLIKYKKVKPNTLAAAFVDTACQEVGW